MNEIIKRVSAKLGAGGLRNRITAKLTAQDKLAVEAEQADKADYKIEVMFHRKRSTLPNKPTAVMVLIWESGKKLHGGGDQKMFWCGYPDCEKPFSSDNFGYAHAVCPHCKREVFLDEQSKATHIRHANRDRLNTDGLKKMPIVIGERLANLTPPNLAALLEKTWHQLDGKADVYLKYSPYEIRYDIKFETTKDIDNLDKVRTTRDPLIYTLKAIRKDIAHGADLRGRFLAMLTA